MNCFYHPDVPNVSVCKDCGTGLCVNCASRFSFPICKRCNSNRVSGEIKFIKKDFGHVLLGSVLLVLIFVSFIIRHEIMVDHSVNSFSDLFSHYLDYLAFVLLIIGFYYISMAIVVGWKTLKNFDSTYFRVIPIVGIVFYLFIKLYASIFVGVVWTPFWFYKKRNRLSELKVVSYDT